MIQSLIGAGIVILYFIIAASVALTCRLLFRIPDEIFRKILHFILLGSLIIFVFSFETWYSSALTAIAFEVVVYPVLIFFEKFKTYTRMTTERTKGELKSSLLIVFTMFAVTIGVCWGWLGDRHLVLATVYAWGFGDAAAALIGKYFGKHKFRLKYIDKNKSIEGSGAMFVVSFASVAAVLAFRGGLGIIGLIVTTLVTALVSAVAELCSKRGMDTVICPLSAMAVLLPLLHLFGGGV